MWVIGRDLLAERNLKSDCLVIPADPTAKTNNIMKTKFLTLSAIAAAFITSHATAALLPYNDFRDFDIIDQEVTTQGLTGTLDVQFVDDDSINFDIAGFNPASHIVSNVALAFTFYELTDIGRTWARVDFSLGDAGAFVINQTPLGIGLPASDVFEFDYIFDSASLSDEVALKLIADVQDDGAINWAVEVEQDSGIHLFGAAMGVEVTAVPDSGSTFALFGCGILGLVIVGRRRKV